MQTLQKNIGETIEEELRQRAIKDGNELRLLQGTKAAPRNPKAKDKPKKKS